MGHRVPAAAGGQCAAAGHTCMCTMCQHCIHDSCSGLGEPKHARSSLLALEKQGDILLRCIQLTVAHVPVWTRMTEARQHDYAGQAARFMYRRPGRLQRTQPPVAAALQASATAVSLKQRTHGHARRCQRFQLLQQGAAPGAAQLGHLGRHHSSREMQGSLGGLHARLTLCKESEVWQGKYTFGDTRLVLSMACQYHRQQTCLSPLPHCGSCCDDKSHPAAMPPSSKPTQALAQADLQARRRSGLALSQAGTAAPDHGPRWPAAASGPGRRRSVQHSAPGRGVPHGRTLCSPP